MINVTKKDIALALVRNDDVVTRDENSFAVGLEMLGCAITLMCFTNADRAAEELESVLMAIKEVAEKMDSKEEHLLKKAEAILKNGIELVTPLKEV